MKDRMNALFKIVVLVLLIALLFLITINGRYSTMSNGIVFDKWTKKAYRIQSDEIPLIYNGEKQ